MATDAFGSEDHMTYEEFFHEVVKLTDKAFISKELDLDFVNAENLETLIGKVNPDLVDPKR